MAGRAGRLGKEFSGNIFVIDYDTWGSNPIAGDKDQVIKPSIESHIVDQADELIAYIGDKLHKPNRHKPDELENTFAKLVRDQLDGRLETTLDRVGLPAAEPRRASLISAIEGAIADTNISRETLIASPTVTIHRQQSLYEILGHSLKRSGAESILPKHPLDQKAYDSYANAMQRCHEAILRYPKTDKSHRYFALIALRWIRGESLPQIIDASYQHQVDIGKSPKLATVIRNTLNDIEQELRYKYVRLFSCYNAVLEQVLGDNQRMDLLGSIPAIPMYLEVGACSATMISFMGLGLSRYTAGKLNALPRRTDMSQNDARKWILRQDLDTLNLPSAAVKEIRRMVFDVGT